MSKYGVISGPYLPAFGLNTERYFGFLGIQSECGEIRTRNNSVFGLFSCSVHATVLSLSSLTLAYCKWKKWFAWAVAAGKCKKNLYRKKCRTQLGRNHSRLFNKIVSLKNSKKKTGMNFAKFLRTFFFKKKKRSFGLRHLSIFLPQYYTSVLKQQNKTLDSICVILMVARLLYGK